MLSLPMSWAPLVITFAVPVAAQDAPAAGEPVQGSRRHWHPPRYRGCDQAEGELGSIVEAISAEDIGKLPDTSIAESIARLPGLTSQRAEGRASAITCAARIRLHHHAAERPRAGEHRRQPQH